MPDQGAERVDSKLVERFICNFGAPMILHSDQGSNFESEVFQEMCKLLDIDETRTTALRPQSDGMVERANRTIEATLASFVDKNQKDWDAFLPFVMMAYRSFIHENTGVSPNRVMFGREVTLPVDLRTLELVAE